jgi:hypothetical protein
VTARTSIVTRLHRYSHVCPLTYGRPAATTCFE